MFHLNIVAYTFLLALFKYTNVYADLTENEWDDLIKATSEGFQTCLEEFDISSSEEDKMYSDPEYNYDPKFILCFFTQIGLMDKGLFEFEKSMVFSKKYVQREEELSRLHKIRQECSRVNKAEVGDGEQGNLERAKLLYDCLKEKGDELVADDKDRE